MIFIFLHISNDNNRNLDLIQLFISSIFTIYKDARLVQVSDKKTPKLERIDEIFRYDGDPSNIIQFRNEAYANLKLIKPAIYLDSDMVLLKPFEKNDIIFKKKDVLLKRSFDTDKIFNEEYKNLNFSEYKNMSLGEAFPFIGCFVKSNSYLLWDEISKESLKLHNKYLKWYGDQVVLRNLYEKNNQNYSLVHESLYACPPQYINKKKFPYIIHFKGNLKNFGSNGINMIKNYLDVYKKN